jgi:hypothetical protein
VESGPSFFVVSLDWTRPKRNDCQASHAFHSRWAFPLCLAEIYITSKAISATATCSQVVAARGAKAAPEVVQQS